MMLKTIILDLDGPILNVKYRQYACYQQILERHDIVPLSMTRYWKLKRLRTPLAHQLTLSHAAEIQDDFAKTWLEWIERPDFLQMDCIQPGVFKKLQRWKQDNLQLLLVTMRRSALALSDQLAFLELQDIFDLVLVCDHSLGGEGKAQAVRTALPNLSPEACLWVGDTEADVEAARSFGCGVWAVTCGLRMPGYLKSLRPNFVSSDLRRVNVRQFDVQNIAR